MNESKDTNPHQHLYFGKNLPKDAKPAYCTLGTCAPKPPVASTEATDDDVQREEIAKYLWARYDSTGPGDGYTWEQMGDSIRVHYYTEADDILGFLQQGKQLKAFPRELDGEDDWGMDDDE